MRGKGNLPVLVRERGDCFSVSAEDNAGEAYPPTVFGTALGGWCGVVAAVGECGVALDGDEGCEGEGDDEQRDYHPPECACYTEVRVYELG